MADDSSKNNTIPRDEAPRNENREISEMRGPLDVPQEERGEDIPTLADRMLARQSVPIRHEIPDGAVDRGQSAPSELREAIGDAEGTGQAPVPQKSVSILRKRFARFKSIKRGYYSFIILVALYALSFALPLFVNNSALIVHYKGETYFPLFSYYPGSLFGQAGQSGEADYRKLNETFKAADDGSWVLMPLYHWGPYESDFEESGSPPHPPSSRHLLGTDDTGRDVLARMAYGFNVSISFAIMLTFIQYIIGATLGSLMGYYGGKLDLISQRFVEIWSNIPFLYMVIIVSSILIPSFMLLIFIISLFGWIGISYYMRGEFLREKGRDYVAAAIALGATDSQIIFKHILPNALTPLIASFPFTIVAGITALVSLDYLGFGLPAPTPSWGQMVGVGLGNLKWWLVVAPLSAMFITLLLVTFIGEAIREAFDPRVFSRLR
jgi:microcin C transport system permease protein